MTPPPDGGTIKNAKRTRRVPEIAYMMKANQLVLSITFAPASLTPRHILPIQRMKIEYLPDTDSLYIDLFAETSVDSKEVSDGVVADFDELGNSVGIDIDQAKKKLDLKELNLRKIPLVTEKIIA